MIIDWPTDVFQIYCDDILLTLPTLAYLSLWNYYQISKILKSRYLVRILVCYDGLTYLLSQDNTFRTPRPDSGHVPLDGTAIELLPMTHTDPIISHDDTNNISKWAYL